MSQRAFPCADLRALLLGLFVTAGVVAATEVPDAAVNPVSGLIEVTDAVQDGGDFEIRFAETDAQGGSPETTILTEDEVHDMGPRIEITAGGDTWIVWWRDSEAPQALVRVRELGRGSWGEEYELSAPGEAGRHPTIARNGAVIWIAYEAATIGGSQIKVSHTDDGPDPIPAATVVATTQFENPDSLVQTESGSVWVSWIDSTTAVGWSVYDESTDTWSAPASEPYDGSIVTVKDAREEIRLTVLGQ